MSPVNQMKTFLKIFALSLFLIASTTKPANAQNVPTLEVAAPTANQTMYSAKVPILFNVTNFELTEETQGAKPLAGQGHILLWLDDQNPTIDSATKVATDTFTYSDVAYGNHTLVAELVTTDNKSLIPPQKTTVNFISAAVPSTEEPKISSSFDKNTAMVILVVVALVIIAAWWYTKDEDDETPVKKEVKNKITKPKTTKKAKRKTKKKIS
jgi:hypothetical protein